MNNNQFSIYPNPSSGIINVNASGKIDVVKVTNLLGQLIYEARPEQEKISFELKYEGIYFITVTSGERVTTQKIIVSH